MDVRRILWSVVFLVAGAAGQSVKYPGPVCAVKGSTVTLPCTFTPSRTFTDGTGREVLVQVIRVRWCQNHEICQGTTPSVHDSQSPNNNNNNNNNPRYQYLGDLRENCTLQIRDLQKEDDAVLRFRMEAQDTKGHYTEKSGVKVTVVDGTNLRINSFSSDTVLRSGQTVTLHCTSDCTFHQLEVTWFRDGHALSESGPALQLGPLTAKDSGNYTCALKTKSSTPSQPYSLSVEASEEDNSGNYVMTVGVVVGVLLPLSFLLLLLFFLRRKRVAAAAAADKDQEAEEHEQQQHHDHVYSSIMQRGNPQPVSHAPEDTNYSTVQFIETNRTRRLEDAESAVIYSSVANRG